MPVMDGVDLAAALHALPRCHRLPLIVLSSLSWREPPGRTPQLVAHVTKPPKSASLHAAVRRAVGRQLPLVDNNGGVAAGPPLQVKVLLAEDNPINQKVALMLLRRLGYEADIAANGVEALIALHRIPYDLVFMDVQMPEMDGLEATRRIRSDFATHRQPIVIAMTANALPEDRTDCLRSGMDEYLSKPFRMDQVAAVIAKCTSGSPGTGQPVSV